MGDASLCVQPSHSVCVHIHGHLRAHTFLTVTMQQGMVQLGKDALVTHIGAKM